MTLTDLAIEDPTPSTLEKSALGRAQLIIDAFTPESPELSLGALARRAGLPKSTAHRFIEQMISLGWLERRHSGYRIGIKLFEMGEMCERRNNLCRSAKSPLLRLSQRTGRSAYLSVLDGTTVLCVDRIGAPGTPPTRAGRRIRFPVLTTTFGRAIVAFESADEIDHQIDVLGEGGPVHSATAIAIHDDLASIRAQGYAVGRSRRSEMGFIAIPVRNSGRPIASICLAVPADELDGRHVEAMRDTSTAIWNDLFPVRTR